MRVETQAHNQSFLPALENILNELMANGQGQPTDPPAPENVIEDLPRVILEDNRKI